MDRLTAEHMARDRRDLAAALADTRAGTSGAQTAARDNDNSATLDYVPDDPYAKRAEREARTGMWAYVPPRP